MKFLSILLTIFITTNIWANDFCKILKLKGTNLLNLDYQKFDQNLEGGLCWPHAGG